MHATKLTFLSSSIWDAHASGSLQQLTVSLYLFLGTFQSSTIIQKMVNIGAINSHVKVTFKMKQWQDFWTG